MALIKILMDTNAYVAFKQGKQQAIEVISHAQIIGISVIVLGELLAGFAVGNRELENQKELEQFLNTPRLTLLPLDNVTAKYYATVYQRLKNKGKPIPTNDLWIVATALQHDFALFSYDKHFSYIDNLLLGQQLEDFYLEK